MCASAAIDMYDSLYRLGYARTGVALCTNGGARLHLRLCTGVQTCDLCAAQSQPEGKDTNQWTANNSSARLDTILRNIIQCDEVKLNISL